MTMPAQASDRHAQIVIAVREAIQLSIERGIAAVGRQDGFAANPAIRISIPEQLGKVESVLRLAGQEERVEKFAVSLNRAAEHAAPAARGRCSSPCQSSCSTMPLACSPPGRRRPPTS
jgi:hypothetical protein